MSILQHTFGILFRPTNEWQVIRKKNRNALQVFVTHIPFLALIPTLSAYIGVTQIGWTIGDGHTVKLTTSSAATLCVLAYFAVVAAVYLLGVFIHWMSKTYGVEDPDQQRHYGSMALAVAIATPVLFAGFANLYPQLWVVVGAMGLAACYAIYLVYDGTAVLMNIPRERAFMYASSIITVGLVLTVSVMMVTTVVWGMGIGPIYTD